MKILGVLLALAVAAQAVPVEFENGDVVENSIIINALIKRAVERVREIIYNGHDELGVPVLDPLRIFATNLQLPGRLMNFNLSLAGTEMRGIGDFTADLNFNLPRMSLDYDIVWKNSNIIIKSAHYNLTGLIAGVIPFYGLGVTDYELVNLRLIGTAMIGFEENSLVVKEIRDATFSLDELLANTSGYLDGGDMDNVMNAVIEDLVPPYITRFSAPISRLTIPYIASAINIAFREIDFISILN